MKTTILTLFLLAGVTLAAREKPDRTDYKALFSGTEPIEAEGFDSHVELRWKPVRGAIRYEVYTVTEATQRLIAETKYHYWLDFVPSSGRNREHAYRVIPYNVEGNPLKETPVIRAKVSDMTDMELLRMVQRYTFRYFWEFADPHSGLALERSNSAFRNYVTTGGSGFGIMALLTGVQNGFITREEGLGRLEKIVSSLEKFERFHGAWAHWYDGASGKAAPFSAKDDGGDLVETAFLVQGLLAAQGYFDRKQSAERLLRGRIEKLWREVEWSHYTNGKEVLYWHWSPKHDFGMNHSIRGYDETLITYVLAAASPTYPIDKKIYDQGWVNDTEGEFFCFTDFYGILLPLGKRARLGGPLFWVHYSYTGLDPRGLSDRYADYWEQNRRYTLVNRAYCIDNPFNWKGYGADFWGLTASDGLPSGYYGHAPGSGTDRGTVAPTAALSSMPYTPEESLQVLKNLYRNHGAETFGIMGFYDAVNFSTGGRTTTESYLAIDQGPIVVMIENHLNATVWNSFMKNNDVRRGLDRLGFRINGAKIAYEH